MNSLNSKVPYEIFGTQSASKAHGINQLTEFVALKVLSLNFVTQLKQLKHLEYTN